MMSCREMGVPMKLKGNPEQHVDAFYYTLHHIHICSRDLHIPNTVPSSSVCTVWYIQRVLQVACDMTQQTMGEGVPRKV